MKLAVAFLLLAAVSQAVEPTAKKQKKPSNTEKRALAEGNSALEKRAPASPTASPGIEYADAEDQPEQSPANIYATPAAPQIAKISDVLTGQGPPFHTAIASHLFSPISVYQPRLSSPTIFEVSAPVPSQLAYSEHKISYQPQQNALPYAPIQKLNRPNFAPINHQQPSQQLYQQPSQQLYQQPSQQLYQQPYQQLQQFVPQQPILYQQQLYPVPHLYQPNYQNSVQYQGPQVFSQQPVPLSQSGIIYTQDSQPQPQKELKTQLEPIRVLEKQVTAPAAQNYNNQGAVSYASFSQSPPSAPAAQIQPKIQAPYYKQEQSIPPPTQTKIQAQFYPQAQAVPQPAKIQAQYFEAQSTQDPTKLGPSKTRPVVYFRQGPALQQFYQPQYQGQEILAQNQGFVPQQVGVAPTFAPVQYFGKFAQSIFGGYQQ